MIHSARRSRRRLVSRFSNCYLFSKKIEMRGEHEAQKRLGPENVNCRTVHFGFAHNGQSTIPATQAAPTAEKRDLWRRPSADRRRRIAVATFEQPTPGS